jgi:hypothetical protein
LGIFPEHGQRYLFTKPSIAIAPPQNAIVAVYELHGNEPLINANDRGKRSPDVLSSKTA